MSSVSNEFRMAALRRGILVVSTRGAVDKLTAFSAGIELANLGFIVENPNQLCGVDHQTLDDTITRAREIAGSDRDVNPVNPGYPVPELATLEATMEQILHCRSHGTLLPNHPSTAGNGLSIKEMVSNARNLRVVNAWTAAKELTSTLASDTETLSAEDKVMLELAVQVMPPAVEFVIETVKNSKNAENVKSFLSAVVNNEPHRSKRNMVLSRDEVVQAVVPVITNHDVLNAVTELFAVPADS